MKRNYFFCLIIILLTLVAYSNSFEDSFQHDDIHTIVRNPFIKDPGNISQFFLQPQMGSGIYNETNGYRPLLMATFALNFYLGRLNVFGYHLVNFGLHVLCALFIYFIIFASFRFINFSTEVNLTRYQLTALFGALIFALHPAQTESVTYINGRSSLLTGLFFLGSFCAYLQYGLSLRIRYLIFSFLSYAGALLVKEIAITLLVLLILFNFLFPHGRTWKNRALSLLPHLLLSLLYLGIRIYFFGTLQYSFQPVRSFCDHLLSQPRAWVHYLGTFILPLNLNIDYDFPASHSIMESGVILSILLLIAGALVIGYLSRSNRSVGFWALWFVITLAPTNSLIVLEDLVSDRWLYLPSVGFAALTAYAMSWIFQSCVEGRKRAAKIIFFFICALMIELYGYSTLLRNFIWTSPRTLWEDAVAKSPNKARPYNSLGIALIMEGRYIEAGQMFHQAIFLEPRGGQAYLNLGVVYVEQGKIEKAIEVFERAKPLNPKLLSEIHNNLGSIFFKQGRMEEAERELREAIKARSHHAPPYYNLGLYFEEKGDLDQAIWHIEKAVKLDPDYSQCYEALIRLYDAKGWKEKSWETQQKFLKYSRG